MTNHKYTKLWIKHEYNTNGRSLIFEDETRAINDTITDNSNLLTSNGSSMTNGGTTTITNSFSWSQEKKSIKHLYDSTFIGFTITWSASVTGTINHKINGDSYANEWTNYVNL